MRLLVSLVNVKPLGVIESFYSRLSNNSVQLTEHLYSKVNVIHVCSGTTGDPSSLPHSFGLDQKAQEWVGGRRAYQNLWLISFHVTRAFTRQSLTAKSETADTTAYCWVFFSALTQEVLWSYSQRDCHFFLSLSVSFLFSQNQFSVSVVVGNAE